LQYLDFTNQKSRPWEKLIEEVKAASQRPLSYSLNIPLNSPPYIRQAVKSLDSAVGSDRAGAIETLMHANSQEACTVLKEALKHPLSDVCQNAASAFGYIGDIEAISALQEALQDPDANVRENAAWALGQTEDTKAIPALQEALCDHCRHS
jgi:HEAT repeat protein